MGSLLSAPFSHSGFLLHYDGIYRFNKLLSVLPAESLVCFLVCFLVLAGVVGHPYTISPAV